MTTVDPAVSKEAHDLMLSMAGDALLDHDKAACRHCTPGTEEIAGMSDTTAAVETFTKDQLDAAVTAAVEKAVGDTTKVLQAEIDGLRKAAEDSEVTAKIDEATADLRKQLDEATAALEAKDIELKTERDERAAEKAAADKAEQDRLIEERRVERAETMKASKAFTDEYVESDVFAQRTHVWAAMSDEEFEAQLAEYKALRPAADEAEDPNADPAKDQKVPVDGLVDTTKDTDTRSAVQQLAHRKRAANAGRAFAGKAD